MVSPWGRALPGSGCGKAHHQLQEGASLFFFFRGEIKCFWQQVPLWRPTPSLSRVVGRWWPCRRPASTAQPPQAQPHMPRSAPGTACQIRNHFSSTTHVVEATTSKGKLFSSISGYQTQKGRRWMSLTCCVVETLPEINSNTVSGVAFFTAKMVRIVLGERGKGCGVFFKCRSS